MAGVDSCAVEEPCESGDGAAVGCLGYVGGFVPAGVLAHEFERSSSSDFRVTTIAALAARLTSLLSLIGQLILVVLAPKTYS